MSYQFPPELEQLVREEMASGNYTSQDDLIRRALIALRHEQIDFQAVEQAIREWQAGDPGVPLDEAFALIRSRHEISQET